MTIIASAPTRCGLIGGGTDVNPYAAKYGGKVLSFALNLRIQTTLTPHSAKTVHLESLGEKRTLYSLQKKLNYGKDPKFDLVRSVINYFLKDIPSGFTLKTETLAENVLGLGSSGATCVSMIAAMSFWLKKSLSPMEMALLAWRLETEELGWPGGKQDQLAAAFGGINLLTFGPEDGVGVIPQQFESKILKLLHDWSLMVFTGGYRHSKEQQQVLTTGMSDQKKLTALNHLKSGVDKAIEVIEKGDIKALGLILDCAWEDKKRSNPIASNEVIDHFYLVAQKNGMLGGKIMGAGGAGNLFMIVPPTKKQRVIKALVKESGTLVNFKFARVGVKIRSKK